MGMREPLLMVATGQKKVGKTYTTTHEVINPYIISNPTTGKKARKVVIYDVNMEYTQYKAIAVQDLKKFTLQNRIEIRRVLPRLDDGSIAKNDELVDIMKDILNNYAGGLLVLEDINRYLVDTTHAKDIIGTITTNRHRDLDIIIHLQSLAAMTPRFFQNTSVIRLHKQQDNIDTYKGRIPYYEILKIAEILVHNEYYRGNERFYCFVSAEEGYIRGVFDNNSFKAACEQYCKRYATQEIKALTLDFKGQTQNPRQEAINKLTAELIQKYQR